MEEIKSVEGIKLGAKGPIALIGFMGVGKSTVGRFYTRMYGKQFIDLDEEIEKQVQVSIPEFFRTRGLDAFREIEHDCLRKALLEDAVISCGGGIVDHEANHTLLTNLSSCIWLDADPSYCFARIEKGTRPLLNTENGLETAIELYQSRETLYRFYSNFKIEVADKSIDTICQEIDAKIRP